MSNNSPLGAYAAPVAALTAVGIIGAYILSLFVPNVPLDARAQLGGLALLAIGAVFGSAVAVNGYKAPLTAAHQRLDRLQAAVTATAAGASNPDTAGVVASILDESHDGTPPPPAGPVSIPPG